MLGATPSGGKILNFSWVSAAFTFSHYKTTQSERKILCDVMHSVVLQHTMSGIIILPFFHHLLPLLQRYDDILLRPDIINLI